MIERLRKRVFWSIFLSAASVLLVILIALNALNAVQTLHKADEILHSASDVMPMDGQDRGMQRGKNDRKRGRSDFLRSVAKGELGMLQLDEEGAVVSVFGVAESDTESFTAVIHQALSDEDREGTCDGWMYRIQKGQEGTLLFVFDPGSLYAEIWAEIALSLAGFFLACLLFALLAHFLSGRITLPAERAMESQKRFIADASHELKTPLTVIDANAALLEKSIGKNKWLGYIESESQRMAGLVAALLKLSELDEGKGQKQGQAGSFDAAETLTEAILPFESVAFEKGAMLTMDIPDTLPVTGFSQDLGQITGILLDNAIKHTEEGGSVQVSAKQVQRRMGRTEQDAVQVKVSNTGSEIPKEALPHIFERFYKADPSRRYSENSYGLGLAIAKGIADQHDWHLSVSSEDGVTAFTLELPKG